MFGIEALDGTKRQTSKTRKKGRLERGMSGDGTNGSQTDPTTVGAALKAVTGLRMRAKLRALAKKK